jgi:uncharacterized protein (DUF779 family)
LYFLPEPANITSCEISRKTKINDAVVVEGEKVTLMCNISGSKPLYISWTNGTEVWNNASLIFESVNRRDYGTYSMTVNNGEECNKTDKANLTLNVYCKYY